MSSTLWFAFGKKWRKPHYEATLFGPVVRFGWLSFGLLPYDLPSWVASWHGKLREALSKGGPA